MPDTLVRCYHCCKAGKIETLHRHLAVCQKKLDLSTVRSLALVAGYSLVPSRKDNKNFVLLRSGNNLVDDDDKSVVRSLLKKL